MKKQRGFTLLELLAVIVLLVIIFIISAPILTNVIANARKESFKSSTRSILKSVEYYLMSTNSYGEGFLILDVGKDDNTSIQVKGKKPDNGTIVKNDLNELGFYMYNEALSLCAIKSYDNEQIMLYEKTTLKECETIITIPKTLSNTVSVGDYVEYDAGNWAETKSYSSLTNLGDMGGYVAGNSKNQGLSCENSGTVLENVSGWRVLSIKNEEVTLVHAGTPECYHNIWGKSNESTTILLERDYSYYINPNYAVSASILTKEAAEETAGFEITAGKGFYTTRDEVLLAGGRYWFPTIDAITNTNNLLYVQPGGYVGSAGTYSYGIRPIVVLKKDIYVTSGTGSKEDPYRSSATEKNKFLSIKDKKITGYWVNWNSTNNIRLADVSDNYNVIAVSFGYTNTNSPTGLIEFELDQYLSKYLGNYSKEEFIQDIRVLRAQGRKVILSIGGNGHDIIVNDKDSINRFVNSTYDLIKEYGFDGIDIDIENTIDPDSLATAINQLAKKVGSTFILTLAPQTINFKADKNGNISGTYYELIKQIQNHIYIVNMQFYNTGTQYGLDGKLYSPSTIDFVTALCSIMLENGLAPEQVGIGIHTDSTKVGYMMADNYVKAYQSLVSGGLTNGGTYIIPKAYKKLGGYMIWNLNEDDTNNHAFSNVFISSLKS